MSDELRAVLTEAQQAVIRERVSMALHAAESNCLEQGQVPGYSAMAEAAVTATCEALASLPGVAVIQLPEPDDDHGDGIAFWTAQEVGVADGMVVARFDPGNEAIYYEPSEAWETVAALAAAAVVAEGEDK
ncbi:hypothetical protein MOMOMIXON_5 [Mycobacterium phage MoMoMixon]|uniref:Uncharacterized protein n=7 Tax=Bixzunavirus TaxID=680114 RepID=Q853S1_BPMBZ|nr:gp6 [Mycobacterium phage Bxz1]YP_002224038.1 hypothetical protein SCOTTMCG_5 [Mycobacterium phage ScottMcG]YP_002224260.1 gp6 [Mycobacterium phage Spud]YP_008061502.1 hypothetical protein M182_gp007 [Mycobacterium phage Astraea]YP_009017341.1 hypothetical protein MOMOMIXON_5 [Mycobacterium phage MoMoMixon]YP_010058563.1 hypothetical protein KHO65_gp004 [Mycobacterium phage Sauce]AER49521.1 hypothetical protein PIO_6 [Mycobacterium phage Pio]QAY12565.1 hypothetical protein SEA_NIDHOGG_5 [M